MASSQQPQQKPPSQPPQQNLQQKIKQGFQRSRINNSNSLKQLDEYNKKIKEYEDRRQQKTKKIYSKNQLQQYTNETDQDIDVPVDGQLEKGSRIFMVYCSACHSLDASSSQGNRGPALGLIFNRIAGNDIRYPGYSSALASSKIYWTSRNLYNFMYNPQQVIKGTLCNIWKGQGIYSEQERADLLAFFREYTRQFQQNIRLKAAKATGYGAIQTELYADSQQKRIAAKRNKEQPKPT